MVIDCFGPDQRARKITALENMLTALRRHPMDVALYAEELRATEAALLALYAEAE